ncbi:MAG: hypothetical protein E7111_03490 [Bacteroidales bacterium]|nr:hypothetical protein [Bacteroidales bacterium]
MKGSKSYSLHSTLDSLTTTVCARAVALVATILLFASCIYDAPDDRFYRTLWVSEEPPFGDAMATYGVGVSGNAGDNSDDTVGGNDVASAGRLTIEFLCGGTVSVTATGAVGTIGTYDTYGETAYFASLRLNYQSGVRGTDPVVIILEEAHRTDDLLLLSWHYSGSPVSYTTRLVRKGSYE